MMDSSDADDAVSGACRWLLGFAAALPYSATRGTVDRLAEGLRETREFLREISNRQRRLVALNEGGQYGPTYTLTEAEWERLADALRVKVEPADIVAARAVVDAIRNEAANERTRLKGRGELSF